MCTVCVLISELTSTAGQFTVSSGSSSSPNTEEEEEETNSSRWRQNVAHSSNFQFELTCLTFRTCGVLKFWQYSPVHTMCTSNFQCTTLLSMQYLRELLASRLVEAQLLQTSAQDSLKLTALFSPTELMCSKRR